jgi:V/A-type H+-transporting ATPase subunit D
LERLRVSATKSNLLRLKDELGFAREGKDLLSQKREVLVMEMLRLQDDVYKAREELDALLAEAYDAFAGAAMLEGFRPLERLALALPEGPPITVQERSVMGVILPVVESASASYRPTYSLARGSFETDRTVRLFLEVRDKLLEVAETETAIYRLAVETRRTIRRERALENLFIPQYEATVKYIEESLEEKERESFYQLKLVKKNAFARKQNE